MSVGAIGAIGAVGIGATGGMGAATGAHALNSGAMVTMTGSAKGMAKNAAPAPSTTVDISGAAQSVLAEDGVNGVASTNELTAALILALLQQLLQNGHGNQSNQGTIG